ncbi:MAG: hypothetical protein QOE92_1118 [Chloroflexota bacterium]|jgi:probable F420-dependent oxidoreductase|nr:hypothetical protein [Chloroflexota bacterium]
MKIGAVLPQTETTADPGALREYIVAVEELGYDHVVLYDHVLGASPEREGGWRGPYSDRDPFHEVLVTLGYAAALTSRIELVTGVLVLPQRQTALVAKQAAEVDILSGGRLRLGVGLGWNRVEYEALNEEFTNRGRRVEEQVELMRRLWAEPVVDFDGEFHSVPRAGLNPLPGRRIPVWMGGSAEAAKRRIARIADGWMMNTPAEQDPEAGLEQMRGLVAEAGREEDFGIEVRFAITDGLEKAAADVTAWAERGITHATVNTMKAGLAWPGGHIDALRKFRELHPA